MPPEVAHTAARRAESRDVPGAVSGSAATDQLAFVLCPSYHGATLLALLLNNHSQITALGDTNPTREFDQSCACGRKVSECPFWEAVRERLPNDGSGHLKNFMPILPAPVQNHHLDGSMSSVSPNAAINRFTGKVAGAAANYLLPIAWRMHPQALSDYVNIWQTFYQYARDLHGTTTVIDGSKTVRKVRLLGQALAGQADIRVIHLVRDPRGFAASTRRVDPAADLRGLAWVWSDLHRQIERLSASVPYLRVQYENLARAPEPEMARILEFLGLSPEPVVGPPRFAAKHHLIGNDMMGTFTGEVKLQERWRHELTPAEQACVCRYAAPATARYGYS